ncbi:MAG: hypothetical protein JWM80_1711, partial [Cyanobacteria bacterium RYN_339]|nr:hypothetical protein [Cyanobacteria bacterium RYN_339]
PPPPLPPAPLPPLFPPTLLPQAETAPAGGGFAKLNAQYPDDDYAFVTAAYHDILGRNNEAAAAARRQPSTLSEIEVEGMVMAIDAMAKVRREGGMMGGVYYAPRDAKTARDEGRKEVIASMLNSDEARHHTGFAESGLAPGVPIRLAYPDGRSVPFLFMSQATSYENPVPTYYKGGAAPLDEPLGFDKGIQGLVVWYLNNGTSKNPLASLTGSVGEAKDAAHYRLDQGSVAQAKLSRLGAMAFDEFYRGYRQMQDLNGNWIEPSIQQDDKWPELDVRLPSGHAKIQNEQDMTDYLAVRRAQVAKLIGELDPKLDPPYTFDTAQELLTVLDAGLAFARATKDGGQAVLMRSVPAATYGWYAHRDAGRAPERPDPALMKQAAGPRWKVESDAIAFAYADRAKADPTSWTTLNWRRYWLA